MTAGWAGQALLEPISADQPCGESLEDDPLLDQALNLFGRSNALPNTIEWAEVRERAVDALDRSRDLRVLVYLSAALLRTDGLPAFLQTLSVAKGWLETHWDATFPRVDEDALFRCSALNCFADRQAIVDGVRRAPVVRHPQLGRFSLRDTELAAGLIPPARENPEDENSPLERVPDGTQIAAAFMAAPLEDLTSLLSAVTEAFAQIKALETILREQAGTEFAPNLEPLAAQLTRVERLLRGEIKKRPDAPKAAAGTDGDQAASPAAAAGVAVGAIASREDAMRALDAVAEFFRHTEPSSPVPIIVERAKRLVSKNFLEVLADIAPGALDQARAAGGIKSDETEP